MPLMQWLASAPQPPQNPMLAQFQGSGFWNPPPAVPRWKSILSAALAGAAGGAGGQNFGEGLSRGFLTAQQLDDQRKQQEMERQQQQLQTYGVMSDIQDREAERDRLGRQEAMITDLLGFDAPDIGMASAPNPQMAGDPLVSGAPPVGTMPGGLPMGDMGDMGGDLLALPVNPNPQQPPATPPQPQMPPPDATQEEVQAWLKQNMPQNVKQAAALALSSGGPDDALKIINDWMIGLGETQYDEREISVGNGTQYQQQTSSDGGRTWVNVGDPYDIRAASGGTDIDIGGPTIMSGGVEPTNAVTTDLQTTILGSQTQIDNLQGMLALYEPEFLTYGGQIKAGVGDFLNKLDPNDRSQMSQRFSNFEQQSLQFFNAYRKWATGVAAGEKELGWLQDSIPSMQDSPQAFEAKIQTMIQRTRLVQIRAQMALRQGITPNTEGWQEWAQAHPLEGIPSINERGKQLEDQGYDENQVIELLRQEGY